MSSLIALVFAAPALTQEADLEIHLTDGRDFVVPGVDLSYNVMLINNGPASVTGVTLSSTLGSDFTGASFNAGIGDYDDQTGMWDNFCLDVGGIATLSIDGTVSASVGQSLISTVSVQPADGNTDPNAANDSSTDIDLKLGIFNDGFESGDTAAWSEIFP